MPHRIPFFQELALSQLNAITPQSSRADFFGALALGGFDTQNRPLLIGQGLQPVIPNGIINSRYSEHEIKHLNRGVFTRENLTFLHLEHSTPFYRLSNDSMFTFGSAACSDNYLPYFGNEP